MRRVEEPRETIFDDDTPVVRWSGENYLLKKMNRSIPGAIQDTNPFKFLNQKFEFFVKTKIYILKKTISLLFWRSSSGLLTFDLISPARYLPRFGQNNAWGTAIREIDEMMKKFYIYDQGGR